LNANQIAAKMKLKDGASNSIGKMTNLNHSSPCLSWRTGWWCSGENLETEAASEMRMSSSLVSTMVRDCLVRNDIKEALQPCSPVSSLQVTWSVA